MKDLIKRSCLEANTEVILMLLPCLELRKESLHFMIRKNNYAGLKLILSCKEVDVNYKDKEENTPLHLAVNQENHDAIKLLLSRGVDLSLRNNVGSTALFLAIEKEYEGVVQMLLEKGKKQSEENINLYSKYFQFCELVVNGNVNCIENYIREEHSEFDINFKDLEGVESPLLLSVLTRKYSVVEALIKSGADVNYRKQDFGFSALHAALKCKVVEIVDLLLEHKANVNCCLSQISLITPLHYAVEAPGKIYTKMLIDHGALINLGENILYTSALHRAAKCGNLTSCKLLLDCGAAVNQVNEINQTPLFLAADQVYGDIVDLLLKYKANPNIQDEKGDTPLLLVCDWADSQSAVECIKNLISHGADTDVRNNEGQTILHKAFGAYSILKFLLEEGLGPNVNCTDKAGKPPISGGEYERNCSDFILLLCQGADINIAEDAFNVPIPSSYLRPEEIENSNNVDPDNLNCPFYAHFYKLRFLGYYVYEDLWLKCKTLVCKDHAFNVPMTEIKAEDFTTELEKLRKFHYSSSNSLYDVLFMKQHQVATLSSNKIFANLYVESNENFETNFPHYGWLLNLQYRRGCRRRTLMNLVQTFITQALGSRDLDMFGDLILRYLNNDHLKQIIKYENILSYKI